MFANLMIHASPRPVSSFITHDPDPFFFYKECIRTSQQETKHWFTNVEAVMSVKQTATLDVSVDQQAPRLHGCQAAPVISLPTTSKQFKIETQ